MKKGLTDNPEGLFSFRGDGETITYTVIQYQTISYAFMFNDFMCF